jgi:plasmid stabilization system protein ParE
MNKIAPLILLAFGVSAAQAESRQIPPAAGAYRSLAEHPRVFTTRTELTELPSRINGPGKYSAERFRQLAAQVTRDLASTNDWDAAYSSCAIKTYLYAFSYEPQDASYRERLRTDLRRRGPGELRWVDP